MPFSALKLKALAQAAGRGDLKALRDLLIDYGETLEGIAPAEMEFLDGVTAGTAAASKALVLGASKEIATITTATITTLNGVPTAEGQTVDPSQKVVLMDDFLAAAIDARFSSTAGSGTANEVLTKVANSVSGEATLKSASDDGAHSANGTTLTLDELNFKANQGGLAMEARIKIDDITDVAIFVGFTDVISTTVELPIFMNAADLDSDAANACGAIFDTDATTDEWTDGGVKANTDTVPIASGVAPVNDTYQTIRVEVSATGTITSYINGTAMAGGSIANAVTITTALTPAIVVANRGGAQRVLTVDYFWASQDR